MHIQKTAGTTLKFIVRNSLGVRHCDVNPLNPAPGTPFDADSLDFVLRVCPWLASISGHEIIEPTRHLAGRVMPYTMLRDPVSRMISHFQDKQAHGAVRLSFDEYLSDETNHNFQVRKIAGEADVEKARELLRDQYFFAGLTERFDESMRVLARLCPYPLDLRCRPQNVSGREGPRKELESDPERLARIREANHLDIELYRYVDEELLPSFRRAAGVRRIEPLPAMADGGVPPWRFVVSRLNHRLVYRQMLKRERRKRGYRRPGSGRG